LEVASKSNLRIKWGFEVNDHPQSGWLEFTRQRSLADFSAQAEKGKSTSVL
jgi:hypothetical protein